MPNTPVYAFPYPSLADSPNGPAQFQALASAVENKIISIDSTDNTQSSNISTLQTTVNTLNMRSLGGRIVTTVGTIHTGITTTETNITKLAFENSSITVGRVYIFNLLLSAQFSAANDSFAVRIRKDTALSGTVLANTAWITQVSGFTHDRPIAVPWIATGSDADADFYVSLQRVAGAGTCDVNGNSLTSFFIYEVTNPGDWTAVP